MVFNESALVGELRELPPPYRVAFAAACAERLFPAYVTFCERAGRGDPGGLAEMLRSVWTDLLGDKPDPARLRDELNRCMALIPGDDDEPWVEDQPYADDAASALAYTLGALQADDPQQAAWAARRAYEALDYQVTHCLGIEDEVQVAEHAIVQAELLRQRRDLDDLRTANGRSTEVIVRLRDRARRDAEVFFDDSH